MIIQPGKIADTPEEIGRDKQSRLRRNYERKLADNDVSSEKSRTKIIERVTLNNIVKSSSFCGKSKVLGIHLVKKITMGRFQTLKKAGLKIWEDKPPCQPTRRRDALTSSR